MPQANLYIAATCTQTNIHDIATAGGKIAWHLDVSIGLKNLQRNLNAIILGTLFEMKFCAIFVNCVDFFQVHLLVRGSILLFFHAKNIPAKTNYTVSSFNSLTKE